MESKLLGAAPWSPHPPRPSPPTVPHPAHATPSPPSSMWKPTSPQCGQPRPCPLQIHGAPLRRPPQWRQRRIPASRPRLVREPALAATRRVAAPTLACGAPRVRFPVDGSQWSCRLLAARGRGLATSAGGAGVGDGGPPPPPLLGPNAATIELAIPVGPKSGPSGPAAASTATPSSFSL